MPECLLELRSPKENTTTKNERSQTLRLYQRKKTSWFELQFEGKRYRHSTKVKNRVKADGIASKFRTALAERRVGMIERKPAPAFEKAMKAFLDFSNNEHQEHQEHHKTYIRYKTSSQALLRFLKFKTKPVDQITPAAVEEYKSYRARQTSKRTKKPITPATINRELACLKAMFFHVQKDHKQVENPVCEVNLLDEGNQQDRGLTFQEQRSYLAVASKALRDIATLMLETGMRPEEVCRIEKKNVHLEEGYVFNPFGKTKAARRRVRLNTAAAATLKSRLKSAEGECLFPHRKDKNRPMLKVNNSHHESAQKIETDETADCVLQALRLPAYVRHPRRSERHGSDDAGRRARAFETEYGDALCAPAGATEGRCDEATGKGKRGGRNRRI
jgi:integrase